MVRVAIKCDYLGFSPVGVIENHGTSTVLFYSQGLGVFLQKELDEQMGSD